MNRQIYYHYLSSKDAIYDLKKERIKVSTLGTLNDPFELMPYRKYKFRERQPYNKAFKEISKKWGILCFSHDWSETLLWSHYANKHTGIAIGFEILQDEVLKVYYNHDPIREQIKLTNYSNTNEKLFLGLAKVKYKKWEYENEYRILVKLEDCLSPTADGLRFIEFENRLKVKEIVLGCKFDHEKEKENIIKLAIRLDAEVIPTRPGWEDYKIHKCGTKTEEYLMLIMRLKNYSQ